MKAKRFSQLEYEVLLGASAFAQGYGGTRGKVRETAELQKVRG